MIPSCMCISRERLQILDMLTGSAEHAKAYGGAKFEDAKGYASDKYDDAREYANEKYADAERVYSDASKKTDKKKTEYESAGKKYWNEKVEQAQKGAEEAKVEL